MVSQPPSPDSDVQIQQDSQGDRNQVIGQVLGGIVINQLTINDRIPATAALPPVSAMKPLTQQEYRQRKVLLNKVKEYWVKGVLETSLHARVLLELGLQERLDLVQRPFCDVAEFLEASVLDLPAGTDTTTVFEQMGAGGTLLILGEPGSGKTISLLKLAEDLIARTEPDLRQPIPVVFNLSSWAKKAHSLEQWLVQELLEKYQVSRALGKTWVETESLILLLDGLDEVKAEQRNACVQALNQFLQVHGTTELTLCCRIRDYQALTARLNLRSAVCIQPLTSAQIDQYFDQTGEQLSALKTGLHQDVELQGLATSPLMLSIMSLAYQDCATKDMPQGGTTEDYRHRLFDTYIDRMFQRRGNTQQYSRQQVQQWLTWLAQRMTTMAQTVFLIERLQFSWLPSRGKCIRHRVVSSLIGGSIIGLIGGLIGGLREGLSGGLASGVFYGISYGLFIGFSGDIKPVETLKWSWQQTKNSLRVGLLWGFLLGLIIGLIVGGLSLILERGLKEVLGGVLACMLTGLLLGLVGGLVSGLIGPEIQQKGEPNQGIWKSAQNATILGFFLD
jgi:hypothetical protein